MDENKTSKQAPGEGAQLMDTQPAEVPAPVDEGVAGTAAAAPDASRIGDASPTLVPAPTSQAGQQPQPMDAEPASAPGTVQSAPREPPTPTSGPTASQPPQNASTAAPESHAPKLGTRIEVLWKITHDDGSVEERWWGAVVQDRLPDKVGTISPAHASHAIHILLYDAYGEFEEDVSRVAFLPNETLLDLAQVHDADKGLLDWRLEQAQETRQVSLEDVVRATEMDLQAAGLPQDADLRYLSSMPAHVQSHMTSGYRAFADGVREMLSELSARHPEGYVVTENDVHEMCRKMKRFT